MCIGLVVFFSISSYVLMGFLVWFVLEVLYEWLVVFVEGGFYGAIRLVNRVVRAFFGGFL